MKNMDRLSVRGKVLTAAAIAFFILSIASPASADSTRWRTIVGIIQANNPVAGIPGGGQPWTTLGGRARVDLAKGQLDFDVQGLVLAGGNSIGTPGAINMVKGTLVCGAGTPGQMIFDACKDKMSGSRPYLLYSRIWTLIGITRRSPKADDGSTQAPSETLSAREAHSGYALPASLL